MRAEPLINSFHISNRDKLVDARSSIAYWSLTHDLTKSAEAIVRNHQELLGSTPMWRPSTSLPDTSWDPWNPWKITLSPELLLALQEKHKDIHDLRERFRVLIEETKPGHPLYQELASLAAAISEKGTYHYGSLTPVGEGISGTYLLLDEEGNPRFVVKPLDEEAGCINSPKFFFGVGQTFRIRDNIPLYRSAMRDVLAYEIAKMVGVDSIAPETVLAIVESESFYDFGNRLDKKDLAKYLEECGSFDREKLCSLQEYIPNARPLWEVLWNLESSGLTDAEMAASFDQEDFENMNLLMWVTYETDGHAGNILAYPKGDGTYGLKKIDNGLAFPDKNSCLINHLAYLDNAKLPLSDAAREKIANIDIDLFCEQFEKYGLESAIPAFKERITYLKQVAQIPGITIRTINTVMQGISF